MASAGTEQNARHLESVYRTRPDLGQGLAGDRHLHAPGARSSLIAWNPASCENSASCTLKITNTENYSFRVIASPIGRFLWGGGFSPNGRQLAAFASSRDIHGDPTAQLAVVNTLSGSLKLVSGVSVYVGESVHWAQWLPDGRHLITGGLTSFGSTVPALDVLVDSQTDHATRSDSWPTGIRTSTYLPWSCREHDHSRTDSGYD